MPVLGDGQSGGTTTRSRREHARSHPDRIDRDLDGRGSVEQVYVKGEKGFVILMSVGEEAVLTALAREQAKLGLIFLDMRRATEDFEKLI